MHDHLLALAHLSVEHATRAEVLAQHARHDLLNLEGIGNETQGVPEFYEELIVAARGRNGCRFRRHSKQP